jgi:hypothetical protein
MVTTRTRGIVTIRLEGADALDVEMTVAALSEALGDRFAITARTPLAGKPGIRVAGVVVGYGIGEAIPEDAPPKKEGSRKRIGSRKAVV